MQLIIDLLNWLTPYGLYSYILMFAILVACGFGLPMPEDVVLITGGILAARGIVDPYTVFFVTMAGVLIGDGIVFFIGYFMGPKVKQFRLFKKILNDKNDAKIYAIFTKYGDKIIFAGRFMPGLRMPIFLTSGIYHVSPIKFFLLDGFAALISVPVWIWVGYVFGANLELLHQKMTQLQTGLYGVMAAVALGLIAIWYVKRKVKAKVG